MKHPRPDRSLQLGMRAGELDGKPYARHWNPRLGPLHEAARDAVSVGPLPAPLVPAFDDMARLCDPGDATLENGYGVGADGTLHVALRTPLPSVSAAMIDWWFAWHSDEPQRYKLWHPRAHVHAAWSRDDGITGGYVGRVSLVDEYIGDELSHVAIQFVPPARLGVSPRGDETVVCARIGFAAQPLDFGWLLHHVRPVAGGAEMRSRFFIGGPHAAVRGAGRAGSLVGRAVGSVMRPPLDKGRALLVHCAQEMAHL